MIPTTTNTAMIPTTAPALNMPPITEQLLKATMSKSIKGTICNFFILGLLFKNDKGTGSVFVLFTLVFITYKSVNPHRLF